MTSPNNKPNSLADVLAIVAAADLAPARRRDMISSINRLCEMAGRSLSAAPAEASAIRAELRKIRPARFGVSAKTFSNQRSLLAAALRQADALDDTERGLARRHPIWGPLLRALGALTQLDDGLAAFANWCAKNGISPDAVTDGSVQQFSIWLETRTLCLKPRDIVRGTPLLWNKAGATVDCWPKTRLSPVSFRAPRKRLAWDSSLTDLTERERFKTILRHYQGERNGKPSAFAVGLAKTLIQAAKHHVGASAEQVANLKALAAKLPAIPFDFTAKNKALLRKLESERLRAKLLFLREELLARVAADSKASRPPFVAGQVAIAIDIQLACPLRPQNLSDLHWRRHFLEPDGPKGRLLLHIPAEETKVKRQDLTVEIPADVARRLRWYRRHILPRVGADPNGFFLSRRREAARASRRSVSRSSKRLQSTSAST